MAGTEVYFDQQKRRQQRKTSTGEDVAEAEATERLGTTKGKDLGSREKRGFVAPKQEPGEDSATWAKRVRKAREEYDAKQAKPADTSYMRGRSTDDAAEALLERKEKR